MFSAPASAWVRRFVTLIRRGGYVLDAFAMLTVVAFEQGEVSVPRPAVIQRIAVVAGPVGHLLGPLGLDMGESQE